MDTTPFTAEQKAYVDEVVRKAKDHPLMPVQKDANDDPLSMKIKRICISTDRFQADWVK